MTYLTTEQIAERLQVYEGTVRRWLRQGQLVGYALGTRGGWRVTEEDLAAFLAQRRNVTDARFAGPRGSAEKAIAA